MENSWNNASVIFRENVTVFLKFTWYIFCDISILSVIFGIASRAWKSELILSVFQQCYYNCKYIAATSGCPDANFCVTSPDYHKPATQPWLNIIFQVTNCHPFLTKTVALTNALMKELATFLSKFACFSGTSNMTSLVFLGDCVCFAQHLFFLRRSVSTIKQRHWVYVMA